MWEMLCKMMNVYKRIKFVSQRKLIECSARIASKLSIRRSVSPLKQVDCLPSTILDSNWFKINQCLVLKKYEDVAETLDKIFQRLVQVRVEGGAHDNGLDCIYDVERIMLEATMSYKNASTSRFSFVDETHALKLIRSISRYYKSLYQLDSVLKDSKDPYLQKLSTHLAWKLFIDGVKNAKHPFVFDTSNDPEEPMEYGYIGALIEAFATMVPLLEKPIELTPKFIRSLHSIATKNVDCTPGGVDVPLDPTVLHPDIKCVFVRCSLGKNINQKGMQELKEKVLDKSGVLYGWTELSRSAEGVPIFSVARRDSFAEYDQQLERVINDFNSRMNPLVSPRERQREIVRFTQNLIQSHPFVDGNNRVFIFLLMNFLLMKEGKPPVILDEPTKLDGYDLDECCALVRKGQCKFLELIIQNF